MKNRPAKESASPARGERMYEGVAVGPGVALGVVHRHDSHAVVQVRERRIPAARVRAEQHRVLEAAAEAASRIEALQARAKRMAGAAGEEVGYLLEAYQQMLSGSRLVRGVQKRIATDRINAEAAVMKEIGLMAEAFAAMDDQYLSARIADISEVGRRLVESLGGKDVETGLDDLPVNAVIVADELSPADTALLDPKRVAGLATILGGVESHTAIVARSLGLPAVVAPPELLEGAENGDEIIIDGTAGRVIINPGAATLSKYRKRRAAFLRSQHSLKKLKTVAAVTRDGFRVHLHANIELPNEIPGVLAAGAEGIGLLRSEFMFMNRESLPSEEEQFEELSQVVKKWAAGPSPSGPSMSALTNWVKRSGWSRVRTRRWGCARSAFR